MNTAQSGRERHLGDKSRPAGRLSRPLTWKWSRLAQGIARFIRESTSGPVAPTGPISSAWYAGIVPEPSDFSNQLCKLQMSLQRESSPEESLSVHPSSVAQG